MTRFFRKNRRLKKTAIVLRRTALMLTAITAVTFAVSAYTSPPVEAGPALFGKDLSTTSMSKTSMTTKSVATKSSYSPTPKGKLIASAAAISPPEAGVQLLMGILQRIGTEPQIAMNQNKSNVQTDMLASNQIPNQMQFFQNQQADPSLIIRPQQALKKSSAGMIPPPPPALTEAFRQINALPKEASYQSVQGTSVEEKQVGGKGYGISTKSAPLNTVAWGKNVSTAGDNAYGGGIPSDEFNQRFGKLQRSLNKMHGAAQRFSELDDGYYKTQSAPASAGTDKRVMNISGERRGTIVSNAPQIKEYGDEGLMDRAAPVSGRLGEAGRSRQEDAEKEPARDVSEMKLEQPAKFKYTREWSNAGAPAGNPIADSRPIVKDFRANEKAKVAKPAASPAPVRIASVPFTPPSLVAGIPGLRLGATESQVAAFVRNKGGVAQKSFNGWKVWSIANSDNKTALQIYVRNGIVEAFRIFDDDYVPDRQLLGVSLSDQVSKMKEKFGEPAFILKEPGNGKNAKGAKNYVYPPSQVSFQLARTEASGSPRIQSLLLFQFL